MFSLKIHLRTGICKKLSKAVSRLNLEHKPRTIRLMRVQYVHETDIREQFWLLGLHVDVTFMFYNPRAPAQPNARKLKRAFPKMKICLCGNDPDLRKIMKRNGDLPPSQWKLPNDMADDFMFKVYIYPHYRISIFVYCVFLGYCWEVGVVAC